LSLFVTVGSLQVTKRLMVTRRRSTYANYCLYFCLAMTSTLVTWKPLICSAQTNTQKNK